VALVTRKLKELFNAAVVRAIARGLRRAYPPFRERAFADACIRQLGRLAANRACGSATRAFHPHESSSAARFDFRLTLRAPGQLAKICLSNKRCTS
jgi:hypothetical protein